MRTLIFERQDEIDFRHLDDIERMENVLATHGYSATRGDLDDAWSAHSETSCASWLGLPEDDDQLFQQLRGMLTESD